MIITNDEVFFAKGETAGFSPNITLGLQILAAQTNLTIDEYLVGVFSGEVVKAKAAFLGQQAAKNYDIISALLLADDSVLSQVRPLLGLTGDIAPVLKV
jgi:hypothetical protein